MNLQLLSYPARLGPSSWIDRFGDEDLPRCACCGVYLKRVIIVDDVDIYGLDCFARKFPAAGRQIRKRVSTSKRRFEAWLGYREMNTQALRHRLDHLDWTKPGPVARLPLWIGQERKIIATVRGDLDLLPGEADAVVALLEADIVEAAGKIGVAASA